MRGAPLAAAAAVALAATACGYHPVRPGVQLSDPGRCVTVDVAAQPELAPVLVAAARRFDGSPAARLADGRCAFARVQAVDAPVALDQLLHGWTDTERLGPAPVVWVPASRAWTALLAARAAAPGSEPAAPPATPVARSPLVIAMPAPMAAALGATHRTLGWADLARLAAAPHGWAAAGHPEWGPFRLGKGNPAWSTPALDATVALDAHAPALVRPLEQAVPYHADSAAPYLAAWAGAASPAAGLRAFSAAVTDERSVVEYDTGHLPGVTDLSGHGHAPALRLVAVYPGDAALASDYPAEVLDEPWTSPDQREGGRRFTQFLLEARQQAAVAAAGFRPVSGAPRSDLLRAAHGVDPAAATAVAPAPAPAAVVQALAHWREARRRARVLVLFDVSNSMGDPAADSVAPGAPGPPVSKLARARDALTRALAQLGSDDVVGLRVFSTGLGPRRDADWQEVVPFGPYAARRAALRTAVAALRPRLGSPLYAATRAAFDDAAQRTGTPRTDASPTDAVVVVTDGYNEDGAHADLHALLAHLAAGPGVRVFTVAYGDGADLASLQKIARATDAWCYDAADARDIAEQLARALAAV